MCTVWGLPNCVWCNEAKKLLEYYFIEYEYKELTSENLSDFSLATGGAKTVPQIFKDKKLIGGFDNLSKYLAA